MPDDQEWEDYFAMIDDVHSHVRATRREVEIDDDPMHLRMGYKDPVTDKTWRIRLTKVKESFGPGVSRTEGFTGLAAECVKTHEGRLRLANLPLGEQAVS